MNFFLGNLSSLFYLCIKYILQLIDGFFNPLVLIMLLIHPRDAIKCWWTLVQNIYKYLKLITYILHKIYVKMQCFSKSSSTIHARSFHKTLCTCIVCLGNFFVINYIQQKKQQISANSKHKLEITTGIT